MTEETTTSAPPPAPDGINDIVGWYTLAATATGAVPVPASSLAIVANNGFMIAHISAKIGAPVTWSTVLSSLGLAGTMNIAGRSVFIEAAKTLSWGTGSIWAAAALSAIGASTAGLQTYVVGLLAIEIARRGGVPLQQDLASVIISDAKRNYKAFLEQMRGKKLSDPGTPDPAKVRDVEGEPPRDEV